jgi:serine/threonine protein kinase
VVHEVPFLTFLPFVQAVAAMKAVPKIPGYELLTCLGGGMLTTVYAARNTSNDAPCAVKLLRPDWADQPIAIKLLQREARACLAVQHPHLVRLHQAHVTRPPYFLVMEMLPGESLRRRLRRDYALEPTTALWIARQVAEALTALHRKGFIHGDVKPDNIRLVADGQAQLLDLGFAHRPGENASLLEAGYVLGTVNYLAPELCGSKPQDDPGNDVFSLGMTLFEMLTGQLPFPPGTTEETLKRHQEGASVNIRDFSLAMPSGLPALLDRLLDLNPLHRPRGSTLLNEFIGLEIATLGRRKAG